LTALYGLTLDWTIISAVKKHVAPYLDDRPDIHIDSVYLYMANGKNYYARSAYTSAHDISAVNIKLTDNSLISVRLRRIYQVESSYALCGHKEETMKSIDKTTRSWYVYVVQCSDDSLYCGITVDIDRRVKEHNESSKGSKYTRSRRPVTLLKHWKVSTQSEAMKAENRFKKLSRDDKIKILGST
jgi:putative endonuclease